MNNLIRNAVSNRMSQSVAVNGFVFLSGQVADDLSGDIRSQTGDVLGKIDTLLENAGVSKSQLVDVKIYIAKGDDFAAMNDVYERWLGGRDQPVRLCLVAAFPNPGYLVEIQALAVAAQG